MNVDLVIRGGTVVTESGALPADLAVRDGRVVALATPGEEHYGAGEVIDARGLHVFPGGIDPHVHFGDQEQSSFEDFASGTRAAAAGGVTTVLDMPLNLPPTIDAATFAVRRAAVAPRAVVDFGLWGGLVPGNLDQLAPMAELGAVAFKAFTCEAADWYRIEDGDLLGPVLRKLQPAARWRQLPRDVPCSGSCCQRQSTTLRGQDDSPMGVQPEQPRPAARAVQFLSGGGAALAVTGSAAGGAPGGEHPWSIGSLRSAIAALCSSASRRPPCRTRCPLARNGSVAAWSTPRSAHR